MELKLKRQLEKTATAVRMNIIEGTFNAGSGHPGGSLSCADVLTYLYFNKMNVSAENPTDENRDRFVLSKGHAAPALYGVLAEKGYFPKEDIKTLRKIDSHLQGHPDMNKTPGVDISTGSLGIGLSNACGMALSSRLKGLDYKVYAVCGDGEIQEGQIWEAAMFAAHYNIDNLTLFVDANKLQIDGKTADVMSVECIEKKFEAFGWYAQRINGHDFDEIEAAVENAEKVVGKPSVIVCDTIKGKGVSFMEDKAGWHGVAPKKDEYETAMAELKAQLDAIED